MSLTRRQVLAAAAVLPVAASLATTATAATHDVTIQGFAFSPDRLTIAAGDTVRFTNRDSAPHTATVANNGPDTGRLNAGATGELTFAAAGTFAYACAFHGNMRGTIIVT